MSAPATVWQPYCESLRTTLLRTVTIAVAIGLVLALRAHDLSRWPLAAGLALWPSLGGHFVELWFLNWLRPRLPGTRAVQVMSRLATWFAGGVALFFAMKVTLMALPGHLHALPARGWWIGGVGFIGIELIVHLVLQLRGAPSFYNGRG
jgi:hypothetical protein